MDLTATQNILSVHERDIAIGLIINRDALSHEQRMERACIHRDTRSRDSSAECREEHAGRLESSRGAPRNPKSGKSCGVETVRTRCRCRPDLVILDCKDEGFEP